MKTIPASEFMKKGYIYENVEILYSLFSIKSNFKDKIRNIGLKSARIKNIEPRSKLTGFYK